MADTTDVFPEVAQKLETATESIKLIKNTKGFNWEIKQLSLDVTKVWQLNDLMQEAANARGAINTNG